MDTIMGYQYRPFPRMLYRGGEQRIVADAHEEALALVEGWHLGPDEPEAAPNTEPLATIEPDAAPEPEPASADDVLVPVARPRGRPRKETP